MGTDTRDIVAAQSLQSPQIQYTDFKSKSTTEY